MRRALWKSASAGEEEEEGERGSLKMRWWRQKESTRADHLTSWACRVLRFVWRVKKAGKEYSRGKGKGGVAVVEGGAVIFGDCWRGKREEGREGRREEGEVVVVFWAERVLEKEDELVMGSSFLGGGFTMVGCYLQGCYQCIGTTIGHGLCICCGTTWDSRS